MNLYQSLIFAVLLVAATSTFVNTSEFWRKKLNFTGPLAYECYSGMRLLMKGIKKSIGTTPRDKQECTTASSEHMHTVLLSQIQEYHSSSGFKVDLEQAHSLVHSLNLAPLELPKIVTIKCHTHGTSWDILFSSISH